MSRFSRRNPYEDDLTAPYVIVGRYQNGGIEEIDEADSKADAEYMLSEYRTAFGTDWELWIRPAAHRFSTLSNPFKTQQEPMPIVWGNPISQCWSSDDGSLVTWKDIPIR